MRRPTLAGADQPLVFATQTTRFCPIQPHSVVMPTHIMTFPFLSGVECGRGVCCEPHGTCKWLDGVRATETVARLN